MPKLNLYSYFHEVTQHWIEKQKVESSLRQAQRIEKTLHCTLGRLGSLMLGDIHVNILQGEIQYISEKNSYVAAVLARQTLILLFDYVIEEGLLRRNPTKNLQLPDKSNHNKSQLLQRSWENLEGITTFSELAAMLDSIPACISDSAKGVITLGILSFQRTSLVRSMRWEDVAIYADNIDTVFWKVDKKNDHNICLTGQAYDLIVEQSCYRWRSEYVFPAPQDTSRCISSSTVRNALARMGLTRLNSGIVRDFARNSIKLHGLAPPHIKLETMEKLLTCNHDPFDEAWDVMAWWDSAITDSRAANYV